MQLGIPTMLGHNALWEPTIPAQTWHRYGRFDPASTFYLFRASRFETKPPGGTLGFYCDDFRLEALWTRRAGWGRDFIRQQWGTLVAPDFSLWTDDPPAVQIWNVYRSRYLARMWQDAGIPVMPNLSWAGPDSYEFCFDGLPEQPPVAWCQTRSVRKPDRPLFIAGLTEAVRRTAPKNIVLYGSAAWLKQAQLPAGPIYHTLSAVIDVTRPHWGKGNK